MQNKLETVSKINVTWKREKQTQKCLTVNNLQQAKPFGIEFLYINKLSLGDNKEPLWPKINANNKTCRESSVQWLNNDIMITNIALGVQINKEYPVPAEYKKFMFWLYEWKNQHIYIEFQSFYDCFDLQ